MKHLYLILFACVLGGNLSAQLSKGTISFGGNIGLSQQFQAEQDYVFGTPAEGFSLNFNPSFSIFLSDHWMLGGTVGASAFSSEGVSADNSFLQPNLRYYFNPEADRLNFFAGISPSFNLNDLEGSRLNLNLGANRFLNSNLALEGSLNYSIGQGSNLLNLGLDLRPFLSRAERQSDEKSTPNFSRGKLILQSGIANISWQRDILGFSLTPNIGLFLNDGTVIGLALSAGTNSRLGNRSDFRASNLLISPYIRQYLSKEGNWRWFGQAGLSYMASSSEFPESFDLQGQAWTAEAQFGVDVFVTEHIAIEPFLRGSYYLGGDSDLNSTFRGIVPTGQTDYGSGPFNLSLGATVRYFFGR